MPHPRFSLLGKQAIPVACRMSITRQTWNSTIKIILRYYSTVQMLNCILRHQKLLFPLHEELQPKYCGRESRQAKPFHSPRGKTVTTLFSGRALLPLIAMTHIYAADDAFTGIVVKGKVSIFKIFPEELQKCQELCQKNVGHSYFQFVIHLHHAVGHRTEPTSFQPIT